MKQKGIIIGVIIFAVLLMAIGYAAIQNSELTITGTATASGSQENFKVFFTGDYTTSSETEGAITVTATNGATTATVKFNEALGLNTKGDTAYAILKIHNGSEGIDAKSVTVTTPADNTEMFEFEAVMCNATGTAITDYSLACNADTYVKVSVKLKETPTDTASANLSVTLTAQPQENT